MVFRDLCCPSNGERIDSHMIMVVCLKFERHENPFLFFFSFSMRSDKRLFLAEYFKPTWNRALSAMSLMRNVESKRCAVGKLTHSVSVKSKHLERVLNRHVASKPST